jgi:hypothetical protein
MVVLAITLGIYAYLILALGLLGWLYKIPVLIVSLPFIFFLFYQLKKNLKFNFTGWQKEIIKDKLIGLLLVLLGIQIIVNFLGAISPELSFDALWYHLPSVKMYVENHRIFYIPGWLLWPASLTRLTEMYYTVGLLFGNEIWAKLIHFSFGIFSAIALSNLLKKYFSLRICLLGIVTFYTMLIVGWQSTTAYIDLSRTFFEILALDMFLQWYSSKKDSLLWESAILLGLAISTKIMAFSSLAAYVILLAFLLKKEKIRKIFVYILLSFLVVSPWLILSFIHTGNPLFPLFGNLKNPSSPGLPVNSLPWFITSLPQFLLFPLKATLLPDDIISPVYLVFLPLVLQTIWKQKIDFKIIGLYVLLGLIFSPRNSNRYLLPYLPALTLVIFSVFNLEYFKTKRWQGLLIIVIIFGALVNLGSRILATKKFVPYLLGKETKAEFLTRNLNFGFGDFYDTDNWFAENIQKQDLVLIYDIHNLYYVNFPYVHQSWAKSGTFITHILVGDNKPLPAKFGRRLMLYHNQKTGVSVFLFGEKLP